VIVGGIVLVLLAAAVAAVVVASANASLSADSAALAKIGLPLGGGKIESVTVVTGPHAKPIPVQLRGDQIWPRKLIGVHEQVQIDVVVKRPGWISWLAGSSEHLRLNLVTPAASLREHYLTVAAGAPLKLLFKSPVAVIEYGPPGQLARHDLGAPTTAVTVPRPAEAGTLSVAAAPRTWESPRAAIVSWFPAGARASAVANPAPGSQILPDTPITLTFSKTVDQALGSAKPPLSPATAGTWHTLNAHTIQFTPTGYGYGLSAKVTIGLPNGINIIGAQQPSTATWTVPGGSTLRVQQLLAELGYLPLTYHGPRVSPSPTAQEAAAVHPPAGTFTWRYGNEPAALHSMWAPGSSGTITKGALMAFQNDHNITADGIAGAVVWKSLLDAAVAGKKSTFGYSFVSVSKGSPESLTLWHNGKTVLTVPVNTGIAAAPTVSGSFPVYEHIQSGTMSGTNPDGSHYNDPGIPYISYFNGGDALHGFTRASYGSPQSLGCVEMTATDAGRVWPYTPIGTIVNVA
jgi:peptidoglycan hydrolase-like protein with peptidoglycan-binding domain